MVDNNFFKNRGPFSLSEVLSTTNTRLVNPDSVDLNVLIMDIAPIEYADKNHLTFLSNKKYRSSLKHSKASFCILAKDEVQNAPASMILLVSDDPYYSYCLVAQKFYPYTDQFNRRQCVQNNFIDPTAKIGINCQIGAGVYIGPNVCIGDDCYIGHNSVIENNVKIGNNVVLVSSISLANCIIGNSVIIHPGTRIGQDGFGYAFYQGIHHKIPQLGRVIIGNNIEIGANSCIDRGSGPDTVIEDGTKIDNLVQIGHNVQIGKGCIIVSQVGISGSTKIGAYSIIGGQAGIAGHINVGQQVQIAAQSGVMSDLQDKEIVGGYPAVPIRQWHKQSIILKRLIKKNEQI